jgi:hypothetical protein
MACSNPDKYHRSDTDCDKFVAPKFVILKYHVSSHLLSKLYMKVPGIEIICISVVVNWSHSSSVNFMSQTWFLTILWTFLSRVYFAKSCGKQSILPMSKRVEVNTKSFFVIHNCLKSDRKYNYNKIIVLFKRAVSVITEGWKVVRKSLLLPVTYIINYSTTRVGRVDA